MEKFNPYSLNENYAEDNFGPSMVMPAYIPSINDILNNPSCLTRAYQPMYHEGDSMEFLEEAEIQDIINDDDIHIKKTRNAPSRPADSGENEVTETTDEVTNGVRD